MNKILLLILITLSQLVFSLTLSQYQKKPKLVVAIVIDQFRADYLTRKETHFLPAKSENKLGGFSYLMSQGAWYPHAKYMMVQNMTGPGHATILSGAYPYLTGIPVNNWYDTEKRKDVYCTADEDFHWLSETKADRAGTSPKNFLGSTFGDELKNLDKNSKVVSLSLKDRAAILMGGKRSDASIWMDPSKLVWTSSKYYFPNGKLPQFVEDANQELEKMRNVTVNASTVFQAFRWPSSLAKDFFPKNITWGNKGFQAEPAGLAVLENLAEKSVTAMNLGKDIHTDLLAVSFSSHDYAGHAYGPDSPAMDVMVEAEDAVLSKLFNSLEQTVPGGMKNVIVVLTADHGVAPNPELAKMKKLGGGRVNEEKLQKGLESALANKFGSESDKWVLRINEMNIFLNHALIEQKKLEAKTVEEEAVRFLSTQPEMLTAFSRHQHLNGNLPSGLHRREIMNSYFPGRSGDVVGILKPYYVSDEDTAVHQTGYAYDATVPLILMGENIKPGVYAQNAEVVDIAPTLAFLTGTLPPALSEGRVLSEAVK